MTLFCVVSLRGHTLARAEAFVGHKSTCANVDWQSTAYSGWLTEGEFASTVTSQGILLVKGLCLPVSLEILVGGK